MVGYALKLKKKAPDGAGAFSFCLSTVRLLGEEPMRKVKQQQQNAVLCFVRPLPAEVRRTIFPLWSFFYL
jgi:hypothetical protein